MQNNNALQVFMYNNQQVRTVMIDGEVWFVAKDVANILDIVDYHQAVEVLDDDERGMYKVPTPGGKQDMTTISKSGVYALIFKSRKPEAKQFSRWVRHEVLPSIEKHGAYLTPKAQEEIINDPDFIIKLAQALKDEKAKSAALQEQADKNKPLVVFAQAVDTSADSILIGNLAKLLRQKGIDIGSTRLFAWLRENNFLIKQRGELWNMPTQSSMDKGLFEVKTRIINAPDGHSKIVHTTKVTGKGQIFFVNYFLDKAHAEQLRG